MGIFPDITAQEAAKYPSLELNFYNEAHVNYTPMDDSPHGAEVMQGLAGSNYVKKFDTK